MPLAQDLASSAPGKNASLALTKLAPPLQAQEWSKYLLKLVDIVPDDYDDFFNRLRARTAAGPAYRRVLLATAEVPTICGMGERTPGENGLTLHPVYGVPYLPGTSLKGILRAWVLSQEWGEDWRPGGVYFRALFGEGGHQGAAAAVDVMDALPAPTAAFFTMDVLTPHFSEYYRAEGKDVPPLGWEGPIPIQFLTASKGLRYRVVLEGDPAWVEKAAEWLALALTERGVGAKSRAGYGHFSCKPLGPDTPEEANAAKRSKEARQTKSERFSEELRRHGKQVVLTEVQKWLLDQPASSMLAEVLPIPHESAPAESLAAVRSVGEEWSFRSEWEGRLNNKKADDKKKDRARQLIDAWDRLFVKERT